MAILRPFSPRMQLSGIALLFLAATLLLHQEAAAQINYATVHGTVTDSSGAVVPNATITITDTSTGIATTVKSNGAGYYIAPQLHIGGPYTVSIVASGFEQFESSGLTLNLNDNRDIDAKLAIGASAQTVQVNAAALAVETSDTQLKQVVTAQEIEQLPLLGRDAAGLQKLEPGSVESSDRFGTYSANGSQTQSNSFLLDGADINDGPLQSEGISVNPDALAEENIVTSTLNPEFSRNGGAIINQSIKSGTNAFHGSGFEFYRDTFLNNGNYFSLPGERPQFHQNIYGGAIGGPILKNKLFFFLAYQGFRNRTGTTTNTPVLSAAQAGGDFSADNNIQTSGQNAVTGLSANPVPFTIGGCVANGVNTWNSCFPSGQIPTTAFNAVSSTLVQKFVPAANNSIGGVPYYNFNTTDTGAQDQGVIRLDYHLSDRDSIWGSSVFQSSPSASTLSFGGGDLPGFGSTQAEHFKLFMTSWTHTFNASTLNEFRAAYFRFNFAAVEPQTITPPSSVGFDITPQSAAAGLPYVNITGLFDLGFSYEGPQPRKDTNLTFADNFSKVVGNHSLKFGASFEQFGVTNPYFADNNGSFTFGGSGAYSSGDPAIDFLLGIPDQYSQTSGSIIDARAREFYAYAQDSWKINSDLTVNYGLAWDAETPNQNLQFGGIAITCWQNSSATTGIFPAASTSTPAPPGLLYPGDPGCNNYGGPTTRWDRFGPRIGFAWSPSTGPGMVLGTEGSHSFAIRGGFGLYYNRDAEEGALQNLGAPPFDKQSFGAADVGGSPGFANPFADVAGGPSEGNPFPYNRPAPRTPLQWGNYATLDINNIDQHYAVPYIYNFNLNVQRALPGNMVMQIGYVGSLGHKLVRIYEGDPITTAGHNACLADPACVASRASLHLDYPQYAAQPAIIPGSVDPVNNPNGTPYYLSVGTQATSGASNYNSFQASLTKAPSHGLSFTLAYTYSHALDNASGLESSGFNGLATNNTPGFTQLSYGDSDYDARHRFIASYNYEIPLLQSMRENRYVHETLGGWHVTGITTLQTGFPVTITDTGVYNSLYCDQYSYYGCSDTPDASTFHIKTLNPRGGYWFDNSQFSQEPIGTYGNVKRNFFHGPGFNYTNLEIYKDVPLNGDGSRYLQLRLESYNAFNHPNFAQPDSNFSDGAQFGQVTSVISPNDVNADPQPGRAIQLGAKIYF